MVNGDKKADEIVEETMKEIFEDLNNSDAFKETEEENETIISSDDDLSGNAGNKGIAGTSRKRRGRRGKRDKKSRKTAVIVLGSVLGVLVFVYVGFAVFFQSHFLFNTMINDTDFSLQSADQVADYMKRQVKDYVLTLEESNGGKEVISGADIVLEYVEGDELQKLVKNQNSFLWITSLWNQPAIEAKVGVVYDETALSEIIAHLQCMQEENQTVSTDAHPEFQESRFVIAPEVIGTQIDEKMFREAVETAINGFQSTLNLQEAGCYILPRYTSKSKKVAVAAESMNDYLGAEVTYDFNPYTETVDSSVISQWIKTDADMQVIFNEEAVKDYIASLAEKYDTKGKTRKFTTAAGDVVTVEGGSYGWRIDQEAEYNALIENIQNAEIITREPNYSSRAATHVDNDMGNTYAEVDLTNQCVYFIQNGQMVFQSDVVTGNTSKDNGTPQGVYSLAYKQKDQVLRGEKLPDGTYEYESPVEYWMPFNGGIGFHDASWRSTFGGTIYEWNGSHGCVNMPVDKAAELYDLISAGTPVVCHY